VLYLMYCRDVVVVVVVIVVVVVVASEAGLERSGAGELLNPRE